MKTLFNLGNQSQTSVIFSLEVITGAGLNIPEVLVDCPLHHAVLPVAHSDVQPFQSVNSTDVELEGDHGRRILLSRYIQDIALCFDAKVAEKGTPYEAGKNRIRHKQSYGGSVQCSEVVRSLIQQVLQMEDMVAQPGTDYEDTSGFDKERLAIADRGVQSMCTKADVVFSRGL